MKNIINSSHWIVKAGLCLGAFAASGAQAQTATISMRLLDVLAQERISKADISQVLTIARQDAAWATGVLGDARSGKYSLKMLSASGSKSADGLRMNFRGSEFVSAMTCGRQGCAADGIVASDSGAISLGVGSFQAKSLGSTCIDGGECHAYIPSWALTRMLRSEGAIQPFPQLSLIVQHAKGLSLYNAETGKHWMTWPASAASELGTLENAAISRTGVLVLTFSEGAALLDFPMDRVLIATDDRLYQIDGTMMAWGNSDRISIVAEEGLGSSAKLVYADESVLIWDGALARLNFDAPVGQSPLVSYQGWAISAIAASADPQGEGHFVLGKTGNAYSTYRLDRGSMSTAFQSLYSAVVAPGSTLGIIGSEPALLTSAGQLRVLTANGLKNTSLGDEGDILQALTHGGVMQRRVGTDGSCQIVHYWHHATSALSVKNSGLSLPCGDLSSRAEGKEFSSITIIAGNEIQSKVSFRSGGS